MYKKEFFKKAKHHKSLYSGMGAVVYYDSGALFAGLMQVQNYGLLVNRKGEERSLSYDRITSVDIVKGNASIFYDDISD